MSPMYYGTEVGVRAGDVVRVTPRWASYYGAGTDRNEIGNREGVVVRCAGNGTWCNVRYEVGPGPLFPEITSTTRQIPIARLMFVRRADGPDAETGAP